MPPDDDGFGSAEVAAVPAVGRCLLHASCVQIDGGAVVLRGASRSGKSDLCLRLIDAGGRLVADDQVLLERAAGEAVVLASPPVTLAGLIEVRGVGILRLPHVAPSRVRLVVDLCPRDEVPRLPAPRECSCELLGVRVPRLGLDPFAASACAKIGFALRAERAH